MKTFIKKKEVVEKLSDVTCDVCGNSCKTIFDGNHWGFEYMTLKANWGFTSEKDLQSWEAHICEKCVDEKLGFVKFKIGQYFP